MALSHSSSMGMSSWDYVGADGNVVASSIGTLMSMTPMQCSSEDVTYGSKESGYRKDLRVKSSSRMSLSATRHIANAFSRSLMLKLDRDFRDTEATHLIVKR